MRRTDEHEAEVPGREPRDHEGDEPRESSPMHVDLPQFVSVETQRPRAKPLPRIAEPVVPTTWRARAKQAATGWRVKGSVQRLLGVLPGGERMHYELQRRIGGLRNFEGECDTKVDDWRIMMDHLRTAGVYLEHSRLMEMGSGWYPTFPICLYLAGAQHVKTVDVAPLMKPELVLRMVDRLGTHLALIAEVGKRDAAAVREKHAKLLAALRRGDTLATATNGAIDYRAPSDASKTGLPASSLDVVFSNSVLEHVPPDVIAACFTEAMRILRPGGIVFHSVNCGDHYAYTDRSITQLNYLAYSDEEWAKWNNAFLYQNRLRAIDFTTMAKAAGFDIELDTSRPHPQRLAQLEKIQVHPRFAHYPKEQLAITSIDFIARKPAPGSGN